MARQRSPNRDKAFEIYKEHGGNITNRAIADLLSEDEKVIAVWKSRDKWNVVQQSSERCTTKKPKSPGAPKGNKNAVGNAGGAAPLHNKNAEKHGFYSKWLPEETLEIFEAIDKVNPIEIQWAAIRAQWTGIIRSQQLMYVRDQADLTKEVKAKGDHSTEWDVQQAWDKQANFLQAQSTAMKTLNSMIKQYEDMLRGELVTEEQRVRIAKLRLEIDQAKGDTFSNPLAEAAKRMAARRGEQSE